MKKSVDVAADLTKQIIALSTAIISLCVAFTDKVFSSHSAQSQSAFLFAALICFVLSIIAGINVLMGLAGHLGRPEEGGESSPKQSVIYEKNVTVSSFCQIILFIIALALTMIYVGKAVFSKDNNQGDMNDSSRFLKVIRVSDFSIENNQVKDTLFLDPMNQE